MLNQGQGTYPQLAGSFYNSAQMMPHDNGRNAQQVPTFFGGLQNMMSASSAMNNYQGMPLNQSILGTQALAHHQYGQGLANTIGGIGTGLGVAGTVGGVGMMLGGGAIASFLGGPITAIAGAGVMATMHVYNKRMKAIEDMRNAMEGSRLGYGLADPITGGLTNQAAFSLSRQMEYSAAGAGFRGSDDLKKVMGQASGLGMLNGMQSLGEVTKRVTDLAKASREIVMLGEGITMSDAMQLQKLTQDMGISTTKFRGMNIGKNLVMAARAAGMSMDQAAQVGGQGAMTFQQLGLGAASGMNAAFFSNIAAKGLTGVGAFSQRQLAALGGEQGIAQNLLMGQASTMGRLSDTLVMGAVKLGGDGQFRIDREMLDRYVRGDISLKEMQQRGKDIGKGMSKGQRAKLLESLNYAMPELKEQASDMLNSEEMMAIQGREILNLRKKTGMSMRRAAQTYFGDTAQAETFLGYAQNYRATRAEGERQRRIADNEQMLKYAGMAKDSSMASAMGRSVVHGFEAVGDFFMAAPKFFGEGLAEQVQRMQDARNRGLKTILGIGDSYEGVGIDLGSTIYGGDNNRSPSNFLAYDRGMLRKPSGGILGGRFSSYTEMANTLLAKGDRTGVDSFLYNTGLTSGLNEIGGGGLGQRLTQYREGGYNFVRKLFGDLTGLEGTTSQQVRDLREAASITDDAIEMGRLIQGNNRFDFQNKGQRAAFRTAIDHLRDVSVKAAQGEGSGNFGGVNSAAIRVSTLRSKLQGQGIVDKQTQDAAIAQAYRYAKSAGGDLSIGFNKMLEETSGVAGMMQLGQDSIEERLDGLRLSGGGFIEAKGLSSALAQAGMSQDDVQNLINGLTFNREGLIQDGAGRDSTEGILRKLNISSYKYRDRMGAVRNVIDALLQGQVTTTGKDGKKTRQGLKEAFTSGTSITLGANAVRSSIDADTLKRLDHLDNITERNLGEGGRFLRRDLISGLSLGSSEKDKEVAREYYINNAEANLSERDIQDGIIREKAIERQRINKEALRLKEIIDEHNKTRPGALNFSDEAAAHRKKSNELTGRMGQLVAQQQALDNPGETYKKELRRRGTTNARALKLGAVSDEKALDYYRTKHTSLLDHSGTLSEALDALAVEQTKGLPEEEREEALRKRREAYSRLMEGRTGANLEKEFRQARSQLQGIEDPDKRQAKALELVQKMMSAGTNLGIENLPGSGKAKSLDSILEEISGGITEFKKAMVAVSRITNDGGVLKIQLPQP